MTDLADKADVFADLPITRYPRRATIAPMAVPSIPSRRTGPLRILVYSDNPRTREQVQLALGKRVHPELPELSYVEVPADTHARIETEQPAAPVPEPAAPPR